MTKIDESKVSLSDEARVTTVLMGLLKEVDPSIVVDGLTVTDDHETNIDGLPTET